MLSLLQNRPSLEKYMVSGVEMVTVTVVLMVPGQSRYPTKQSILIFSLCQTQPGLSDLHSTLCWPSSGPTVRYPSLPPFQHTNLTTSQTQARLRTKIHGGSWTIIVWTW